MEYEELISSTNKEKLVVRFIIKWKWQIIISLAVLFIIFLFPKSTSQTPKIISSKKTKAKTKINTKKISTSLLIKKLKSKNRKTRLIAIRNLGKMGKRAESAVPHLIPLLKGKDKTAKKYVIQSLQKIGKKSDVVIPALAIAIQTQHRKIKPIAKKTSIKTEKQLIISKKKDAGFISKNKKDLSKLYRQRLQIEITTEIKFNPQNKPLTLEFALWKLCQRAKIPYLRKTTQQQLPKISRKKIAKLKFYKQPLKSIFFYLGHQFGISYIVTPQGVYFAPKVIADSTVKTHSKTKEIFKHGPAGW